MTNYTDGPKAENIEHLIQLLASDDLDTCLQAASELGKLGQAAVVHVIAALRSPETGFGAIEALAQIGEPSIAPLIRLLTDSSVDAFAAEALSKIGTAAVPSLIHTLNDQDDSLRFWATGVLGWIGDPRAVEPLKTALSDEDLDVRRSAARALSKMGIQS